MDPSEFAFKHLENSLKVTDYIEWAERLLYEGNESQCVAILASYSLDKSPESEDVKHAFNVCIAELGIDLPTPDRWYEALLDYASFISNKVLNDSLETSDCVSELLNIAEDYNDPYMLTIWQDITWDISETSHIQDPDHIFFNSSLDLKDYEKCCRLTALQFISLCSKPLPDKFPRVWFCLECGYANEQNTWSGVMTENCPCCNRESSLLNMRYYEHRELYLQASPENA